MNFAAYCFVFLTVLINVSSAETKTLHLKESTLPENSSTSLENYDEATLPHQRMARHIELERPSVNSLVKAMKQDLPNEKDRKHIFVDKVFQKLKEKIQDGGTTEKHDASKSSSRHSQTTEENSKKSMRNVQKVLGLMFRRWLSSKRRINEERKRFSNTF